MTNRILSLVTLLVMLMVLMACANDVPQPTLAVPSEAETPVPEGEGADQAADAGGAQEITVEMNDIYFGDDSNNQANPPVWTVGEGAEVTLILNNRGNLEHNWALVARGEEITIPYTADQSDKLLFASKLVAGGEEATDTFFAPEEIGEYLVICTVAGHYPTMQGQLVVE